MKATTMKRTLSVSAVALAMLAAVIGGGGVASASPAHGTPGVTTLDACGYFVGEQTPANSQTTGGTTDEHGTWTGVTNNYGNGPVVSLGSVQGAYHQVTTQGVNGAFTGTESFTSNAGQIVQTFAYVPNVGYSVTVTATKDLSFLTSDTNGGCYGGPVPRP